MEPEVVLLQDATCIKEEPHTDVQQDCQHEHEDDPLNVIIKEEQCKSESSGSDREERTSSSLSYVLGMEYEVVLGDTANETSAHSSDENGHITQANEDIDELHGSEQPQRRYSCSICNQSFTQQGSLKRHMLTHTGLRPYTCDICNKSFTQHGNLKTHMLTHTDQHRYICQLCNKSFTQHGYLKRHVLTHTGQRPYTCDLCNKSFTENGNLNKHMLTHTGERPYACEICNKSFTRLDVLKTHKLTHKGRSYTCEICNKSFPRYGGLRKHSYTHRSK